MKKLIINADDFALSKGVTEGILKTINDGITTSTTIMVNGGNFSHAFALGKKHNLSMGIHLCLTHGKPILSNEKVSTLVDEKGFFKKRNLLLEDKNIDRKQVEKELWAQVDKFLSLDVIPDHLDAHHYIYEYLEDTLEIVGDIAKQLNVPIRQTLDKTKVFCKKNKIYTTDKFFGEFYGDRNEISIDLLEDIFAKSWDGVAELMCHPAVSDDVIENISSYNTCRFKEFEVLTSPEAKELIEKHKIQLISYSDLNF